MDIGALPRAGLGVRVLQALHDLSDSYTSVIIGATATPFYRWGTWGPGHKGWEGLLKYHLVSLGGLAYNPTPHQRSVKFTI